MILRTDLHRPGRTHDLDELTALPGRRVDRAAWVTHPGGLEPVGGDLDDEVLLLVPVVVDLELVEHVGTERVRRTHRRHREAVHGHRQHELRRVQRVDEGIDVGDVGGRIFVGQGRVAVVGAAHDPPRQHHQDRQQDEGEGGQPRGAAG